MSRAGPTDLDRERAHDDLLFRHGGLPIQPTAAVLRNHVVQIPVLQLLCHPLLLVLLGGECLRGIMAMSVMPLEGPQGGVSATLTKAAGAPRLSRSSQLWETSSHHQRHTGRRFRNPGELNRREHQSSVQDRHQSTALRATAYSSKAALLKRFRALPLQWPFSKKIKVSQSYEGFT